MKNIHISHWMHTKGSKTFVTVERDERNLNDNNKRGSSPLYNYFYYNKPITLEKMVKLLKKNKIQVPPRKTAEEYIQDKLTQIFDFGKGNMPLQNY